MCAQPETGAGVLHGFAQVLRHRGALVQGSLREQQWMAQAGADGLARAHLWSAPAGLVAPRSYARLPGWQAACARQQAQGCAVELRASGGGVVPQGPGLLNLSLVWPLADAATADIDAIYRGLAALLADALAPLGLELRPGAVAGSFCDGRYNLAVGARKCIGTAQAWRRQGGRQVVLAHALLIVRADAQRLCDWLNDFEADAGGERRYAAQAITSLEQAWCEARRRAPPARDFERRVVACLLRALRGA